jgi:hypothetical protein
MKEKEETGKTTICSILMGPFFVTTPTHCAVASSQIQSNTH